MSTFSLLPEDKRRDPRRESALESVYSSNSRLSLLQKRKRMGPEMASPGKGTFVTERVLSAKAHRVKQLQNQLADAHYHLQELSNENKILRALQKKQETALQRYENSSAELPSVLHSHGEEIRIQTQRLKQLKAQYREVNLKLKERDMQYQQLKDEHAHLLELSKDRNLLEREKLQAQVQELTARVQQQAETISTLQRRLVLEAKNFRHQLQMEVNKHKDTRHDLDLAINNADKLTTIIEMKEKLLSTAAIRNLKSPIKSSASLRPAAKREPRVREQDSCRGDGDRGERDRTTHMDALTKLSEAPHNIPRNLSPEDGSHSQDHRTRLARRGSSTSTRATPVHTRKMSANAKEADGIELAKTVQEGMADLSIFQEIDFKNPAQEDMQKKLDIMKADLLKKIRSDETHSPVSRKPSFIRKESESTEDTRPPMSRKSSFIRKQEESIDEDINEEPREAKEFKEPERPKSRTRRASSVSFSTEVTLEESSVSNMTIARYNADDIDAKSKRDVISLEKKLAGKPLEKYCKEIMQGIERSNKSIDKHMRQFNQSQMASDKLIEQLQAVDSLNDYVNTNGDVPEETFNVLNNNFKMLTEQVFTETAPVKQRAISGNKRLNETRALLGDNGMSNQELLDDLLGRN